MAVLTTILALIIIPTLITAETLLSAYIFHRHGDRTAKSTPPTSLTELGYHEIFTSGSYFRNRYVASTAASKINGLNNDQVELSQLSISASQDNVLMSSAMGFSQALYPATQVTSSETLRNGTVVQTPLSGYQLIPIAPVSNTGGGAEDSAWLQSSTNCGAAETSSNEYFMTPEYMALLNSTQPFYNRLTPVLNATFSSSQISFKNAYSIFDLINVAEIHNTSIPSSDLLDADTLFQLRTLADTHEWNLAFNESNTIRGIAGAQLAAQVVDFFNATAMSNAQPKLGVQFGNYATFTSYFGFANLLNVPGANNAADSFYGVTDYASAAVWELYTSSDNPTYPVPPQDLSVRFLFHNGTSSNTSELQYYSLFNGSTQGLSWSDFTGNTSQFSIGTTQQWCQVCGNNTGSCAQYAGNSNAASSDAVKSSGSGMSNAVAGVIGAMVTLGVILLVEAAILLLFGLRLGSKKWSNEQVLRTEK